MSTAAQVRTAWSTNVFEKANVQAITTQIHDYDITQDSQKELSKLRFEQQINFITYTVSRTTIGQLIGARTYRYRVEVSVYRETDISGSNYKAASDAFETITDNIVEYLRSSWGDTVDVSTLPIETPRVAQVVIGTRNTWRATQIYTAEKISN